jgi:hypothetical protein
MQEHERTLVTWLEAHGPDDWHQVAIDWNWDAGLDVLAWIAAQADCDRATAQHLILNGGVDYFVGFATRDALMADAPYNVDPYDLLVPTIERWNAGFYVRSEIATDAPETLALKERDYRLAEAARAGAALPWQLDGSVFRPLAGRVFSYRYAEGWPPDVAADLKARRIGF